MDLRAAARDALVAHPAGILQGSIINSPAGSNASTPPCCSPTRAGHRAGDSAARPGRRGHTYRLNSDAVAVEVALALKAVKPIY